MRILLPILILISSISYSQCDTSRYKTNLFSEVFKHADVQYGTAPAWNWPYLDVDLKMDIYEPVGDNQTKRPLMVWIHPGAFLLGDKTADDMVALCDSFAQRGYVTTSLGYRLGFNTLSTSSSERAVYRSVQDLNAGLRFLFENASIYNIDTNYVFIGGSSAGAFTVLHTVYMDQDQVPSSASESPDLGCISCEGNDFNHQPKITGYVSLWGALGDSTWITADETTPGLLVHGTDDAVINYGTGSPFSLFTLPETHGTRCVSNQLNSLGIEHTTVIKEGLGHEFHGTDNGDFNNPPNQYWDTIFNAINAHFTPLVLPESSHEFLGDNEACVDSISVFEINQNENTICWTVEGGDIINSTETSIEVLWNQAGEGLISYRFENQIGAVSDAFNFAVSVEDCSSVGINESAFKSLKVYPNPSEGQLNVSGISGEYDLTILDISGKEILTSHTSNDTSITFPFISGVYFVKIQQDGSEKVVRWIVE